MVYGRVLVPSVLGHGFYHIHFLAWTIYLQLQT